MDHLLKICEIIFWEEFLEKLEQFLGQGSKMDCLLKKGVMLMGVILIAKGN